MIGRRTDPCAVHRTGLLDFAHGLERSPSIVAALHHLDGCRACEAELTEIALAIAALRRIGRDIADVEPPTDAWPGLRTRIERPRRSIPRWTSSLAGTLSAFGLIAALSTRFVVGPAPAAVQPSAETAEQRTSSEFRRYDSGRGYLTASLVLVLSGRSPNDDVARTPEPAVGSPVAVDRSDPDLAPGAPAGSIVDVAAAHRPS
jgi:anti-sigma factor RsiW